MMYLPIFVIDDILTIFMIIILFSYLILYLNKLKSVHYHQKVSGQEIRSIYSMFTLLYSGTKAGLGMYNTPMNKIYYTFYLVLL